MQSAKNSNSNYGRDRLKSLNLTPADGFTFCPYTGDVLIQYHCLNGDRVYYQKESSRKTAAIEAPEQFRNRSPYTARRIAPDRVSNGKKYHRPTGTAAKTFIPLQTRQLYSSSAVCPLLALTEGEIKAAYIAKFGITSAAFAGISLYKLCVDLKRFLKEKQPAVIVLNYDSDARRADDKARLAAFMNSAFWFYTELYTFYKLQGLTLPRVYICIQNEQQPYKGIDDILQAYGQQAATEFKTCRTSEYFTFAEIKPGQAYKCLSEFFNCHSAKLKAFSGAVLRANYFSDKESKSRTRFTDILQAENLPIAALFGKIWAVAPGTGKTTAVIKAAALQRTVFFAPLTGIIEQVYNDAIAAGIDAVKYTGSYSDRQYLADRITGLDLPQMIVCTYASAESLCRMLGSFTKLFNLVIDEFHSTTAAAAPGFMLKQLNGLLDSACHYKTITGLTGTPLLNLHPLTKQLPQVTVKLTAEPKTETELIQAADPLKAAADAFKKSVSAGRLPLVLFNNKKDGLQDLLLMLQGCPVTVFNSETKDSPEFIELLDSGQLGKDSAGIISTTVLEMGINDNTPTPADIIILGQFHPVSIKQLRERKRIADCRLYVIQKFNPKDADKAENLQKQYNSLSETDKTGEQGQKLLKTIKELTTTTARYIDREKEAERMIKQAEKVCSILNEDSACPYVIAIRQNLQSVYIRETAAGFIPDYLAIQNYIFEAEKHWLNSSPERLLKALSQYGFNVYADDKAQKLNIKKTKVERDAETKLNSKIRKEANKAAKAELFMEIAEQLTAAQFPKTEAKKAIKAKDTTAPAKEFYQMYLDIRTYCKTDEQAAELFTATDGKQAKAKQTVLRLKTKRAIFDSHELGNAPAAILNDFRPGQRFTAEQLKAAFIDCLRIDKTINLEPFEKGKRIDAVLKKLRIFFDVIPAGHDKMEYQIKELPKEYF